MFVDEASGTYAGHGFEAVTSTISTPDVVTSWPVRFALDTECSGNFRRCAFDGGEMGSTGAESKWRQTDWYRKYHLN